MTDTRRKYIREYMRAYRAEHRTELRAYDKSRRPSRRISARLWARNNRDKINTALKHRFARHPEARIALRLYRAALAFLLGATLLLFVGLGLHALDALTLTRSHGLYRHAQAETILVESSTGYGSGVVIKRHGRVFVWTAAHVVNNTATVICHRFLRFEGHKAGELGFKGHVIARLPGLDAALLWLEADPAYLEGAEWTDSDPLTPGTPVFHVGNLYGPAFDGSVSTGVVAQNGIAPPMEGWPWPLTDQTTVVMVPGSSGGPLFTQSGAIAGLIVGGPRQGLDGIGCFIPVREILRVAKEIKLDWAVYGSSCPPDSDLRTLAKTQEVLIFLAHILEPVLAP